MEINTPRKRTSPQILRNAFCTYGGVPSVSGGTPVSRVLIAQDVALLKADNKRLNDGELQQYARIVASDIEAGRTPISTQKEGVEEFDMFATADDVDVKAWADNAEVEAKASAKLLRETRDQLRAFEGTIKNEKRVGAAAEAGVEVKNIGKAKQREAELRAREAALLRNDESVREEIRAKAGDVRFSLSDDVVRPARAEERDLFGEVSASPLEEIRVGDIVQLSYGREVVAAKGMKFPESAVVIGRQDDLFGGEGDSRAEAQRAQRKNAGPKPEQLSFPGFEDEQQTLFSLEPKELGEIDQVAVVRDQEGRLLAPNGKPSKLNERQWKQVRTPSFKRWFGNWESLELKKALEALEPVEVLDLDAPAEILDLQRTMPEGWRKSILDWMKGVLPKSVTNPVIGEVLFSNKGLKATLAKSQRNLKILTIPHLPDMIEKGVLLDNATLGRKESIVIGSILKYQGRDYLARVVVKIGNNGQTYYDHEETRIENLGAQTTVNYPEKDKGQIGKPRDTLLLAEMIWNVKPEDVSKVVDENGEPRVVYHGTNSAFTEFVSGEGMFGEGIYLAVDSEYASGFADQTGGYDGAGGNVLPVFARITGEGDGDIILNKRGGVFVAAKPTQIKSATANTGTFDSGNADIRFSLDESDVVRPGRAEVRDLFGGVIKEAVEEA
ncbi:MAG: hypothetical protein ACFCU1_02985 [Sumerlaeia bacterium]